MKIRPGDGDHRHGTYNGYGNLKCRCAACRKAVRDYQAALTQIRAARLGQCSVPGCERGQYAKGYCRAHYKRLRATGELGSAEIVTSSVMDRLLRCSSCREWLPDERFPRNRAAPQRRGRHNLCRECSTLVRQESRVRRSVPCANCGKPRLHPADTGAKLRGLTDSGLCRDCWRLSRRKTAA